MDILNSTVCLFNFVRYRYDSSAEVFCIVFHQ